MGRIDVGERLGVGGRAPGPLDLTAQPSTPVDGRIALAVHQMTELSWLFAAEEKTLERPFLSFSAEELITGALKNPHIRDIVDCVSDHVFGDVIVARGLDTPDRNPAEV